MFCALSLDLINSYLPQNFRIDFNHGITVWDLIWILIVLNILSLISSGLWDQINQCWIAFVIIYNWITQHHWINPSLQHWIVPVITFLIFVSKCFLRQPYSLDPLVWFYRISTKNNVGSPRMHFQKYQLWIGSFGFFYLSIRDLPFYQIFALAIMQFFGYHWFGLTLSTNSWIIWSYWIVMLLDHLIDWIITAIGSWTSNSGCHQHRTS
jgi:hypothetical protein